MSNVVNNTRWDIYRAPVFEYIIINIKHIRPSGFQIASIIVSSWSDHPNTTRWGVPPPPPDRKKTSSDLDKLCGSTFWKCGCLNTHKHPRGYAIKYYVHSTF